MKVKINNNIYQFKKNITILEACRKIGIMVPTLCYLKEINEIASCRICVVEVVGRSNLVPACTTKLVDGMEIFTNSKKVIMARKTNLELILSNHNKDCLSCVKSGHCELQKLCQIYGVESSKYDGAKSETFIDDGNYCIVRDNSKCILCNRCVSVCEKVQGMEILKRNNRGFDTEIGSSFQSKLCDTDCVYCGQCVNVCPTGALSEKYNINEVITKLNNPKLHKIVAYAPAVRVTLGEEFAYPIGTNVNGKLVTSLKCLGFDKVFDINYGADLTVIEEVRELLERLDSGNNLPLITSCCPAWVNYVTKKCPSLKDNLSTCKSPQQMFGAICKTYYAKMYGIDPCDIYVVTIMPCIAKKDEIHHVDNATNQLDVDCVLTTRELAKLIKMYHIDFNSLSNSETDNPLGKGNSVIFGTSGGVLESALRYINDGDRTDLNRVTYTKVNNMPGCYETTIILKNKCIHALAVSGLKNVSKVVDLINEKKCSYDFIEVMACPSGCINGGGTPYVSSDIRHNIDYIFERRKGLYNVSKISNQKNASKNISIKKMYRDYLKKNNYELAHKILHRHYK